MGKRCGGQLRFGIIRELQNITTKSHGTSLNPLTQTYHPGIFQSDVSRYAGDDYVHGTTCNLEKTKVP